MRKYSDMTFLASKALFTSSNVNQLLYDNEEVSVTWNVLSSIVERAEAALEHVFEDANWRDLEARG